jgi:hypothetical protein
MKKLTQLIPLLLFVFSAPCYAEPIRIDIGMDTGRNDTNTPGWHEWQVKNGPQATREFDGIQITLRGVGGELRGDWYKAGLVTGATMATDGVLAKAIELEIRGLPPGHHSLATYHDAFGKHKLSEHVISVAGTSTQNAVQPSAGVPSNDAAQSAFIEFDVDADQPVVVQISAETGETILNGLEIDGTNPKTTARRPLPSSGDEHVNGDDGTVKLSWQPAPQAVKHHIYLSTATSLQEAKDKLRTAAANSSEHISVVSKPHYQLKVDPHASLLHYAWRIDSEDADGKITPGDVWTFRVRHLAFPGAEGYGRFAIGGRGGRVMKVINLNDSGPGSLRAAVEATGPRTIVFDVSGRIAVESKLIIRDPYLTIAGQTAPGKGICISNYNMGLLGNHDCIIRFMRVRPGNTAGVTLDGMGLASCDHSIIDHCSISWTQDESFSSRGAKNITLQRTLISEALNVAGHKKYEKGKEHGYAASIGGDIGSFHHNLLAHCAGRNWSLAGGLDKATEHAGRLDIRNNIVYNWGHRTTDGGAKEVNFVNNYYKPGAASRVFHVLMPEREAVKQFGPQMYYAAGNVMEGRFSAENQLTGIFERRGEPHANWLVAEPFFDSYVTTTTAEGAFQDVVSDVGCNEPLLDEHDQRVVDETLHGTAQYKGSISGLPGLPDTQDDVGGWEDYGHETRPADWDPDNDGLPSWWEKLHGLNPNSPTDDFSDANGDPDDDGYTNLEDYLNWLAVPHFDCKFGEFLNIDLTQLARGYATSKNPFTLGSVQGGSVKFEELGVASFTPDKNFAGLANFVFKVVDVDGHSTERQINIRVLEAESQQ